MAFVQVAAGVFQMRASQVVSLLVEEGKGQGAGREGVDDGRGEAREHRLVLLLRASGERLKTQKKVQLRMYS